ncbi:reverse transcriptase domain-containing protein [Gaetbulibacter sp. M235]|uniref:RNA-directed DNA polymerase n=1 Tax=Gaetbulibacter sp. M235 TaxID=3126510 RepID=UPI00374E7E93
MSNNIALKSLNQYRKRDIIAYLSLRYYLDSKSSQTDLWAREVATNLTLKNESSDFLKIKHFKCFINNEIKFREIHIPSPNDIISESVLISECAKHDSFYTNSAVYSYLLNDTNESIYKHYTNGLNKRFLSIQQACRDKTNEEVLYLDVKSFYPSINLSTIEKIWIKACSDSNIPSLYLELGKKFINKYKIEQKEVKNPGLLIGPMFCHLLANLYLKEIDSFMKTTTLNRYWRYVDDIVIMGNKKEIELFSKELHQKMNNLGLDLHDESKFFRLTTHEWLENESGIDPNLSWKWPKLIGSIKKIAIYQPEKINQLKKIFNEMEVRLEILDYSREVKSAFTSFKFFEWLKRNIKSEKTTIEDIIEYTENLRNKYFELFIKAIKMQVSNELESKTRITRIKYLVGRLIYLAKEKDLKVILENLVEIPELLIQYEIIKTIITRDISTIVKLGTNASQAVAQVIKQNEASLKCKLDPSDKDVIFALSIFKFHGIKIEFTEPTEIKNSFYDFASGDIDSALETDSTYLRQLISLHGRDDSKHEAMLTTLFDENESLSFDVLNAGSVSSYYF